MYLINDFAVIYYEIIFHFIYLYHFFPLNLSASKKETSWRFLNDPQLKFKIGWTRAFLSTVVKLKANQEGIDTLKFVNLQ